MCLESTCLWQKRGKAMTLQKVMLEMSHFLIDGTFSQRIDVSLEGEQSTSPFPSQIEAAEKRVSVCTPTSVSDEPAQSTQRKRLDYPRVQTEREEKSPRGTGSQCTESTDQVSKLSKNQKRKMKKKRHKERIRSGGWVKKGSYKDCPSRNLRNSLYVKTLLENCTKTTTTSKQVELVSKTVELSSSLSQKL